MQNGRCKRNYPKSFFEAIVQGHDSYLIYWRWDLGSVLLDHNENIVVDNVRLLHIVLGYFWNMIII